MPEVWPESLPCSPIRGSFRASFPDNLLRSENAAGPDKVRPKSSAAVEPAQFAMRMTTAQVEILRAFYEDDLLHGSLVFTMPILGLGSAVECRFRQPPERADFAAGKWEVLLSVELMP